MKERKNLLIISVSIFMIGCSSLKYKEALWKKNKTFLSDNSFTGLLVINTKNGDTIINHNSKKYFTPASNTKIFTLYAAQKVLPEKTPVLKYLFNNDTIYIQGTGDPTFLHPYYKDSTILKFLKPYRNIVLNLTNYEGNKYGPGWAWEDYDASFSPEINSMPIYGNVTTVDGNTIVPNYFKDSLIPVKSKKRRALHENIFYLDSPSKDSLEVPFITSNTLIQKLLENALDKKIRLRDKMPYGLKSIVYGIPTDSLCKRMLHESDNFIAEQLLLLSSAMLSDTLNGDSLRNDVLKTYLPNLKQPPRWVDGSGLSRYNLFTPESMVHVLHKIYNEIPKEKLFALFPAGGASGTIKNMYKGNPNPYIYAKSGSLSNNYCLSGYLITKKSDTLIFSFMNNHFRLPSSKIKANVELVLEKIRDMN